MAAATSSVSAAAGNGPVGRLARLRGVEGDVGAANGAAVDVEDAEAEAVLARAEDLA